MAACYGVRVGRVPGVYLTWDDCAAQTAGYPRAEFKKFKSYFDAEAYVRGDSMQPRVPAITPQQEPPAAAPEPPSAKRPREEEPPPDELGALFQDLDAAVLRAVPRLDDGRERTPQTILLDAMYAVRCLTVARK
jgi:ribonuclease HI